MFTTFERPVIQNQSYIVYVDLKIAGLEFDTEMVLIALGTL